MTRDRNAILALCSHLCPEEDIRPLTPGEYSRLTICLDAAQRTPGDLFDFSAADFSSVLNCSPQQTERLLRLIERSPQLNLVLNRYADMGIKTVTRAETDYPQVLTKKLGTAAPAIFFYAGDISLLKRQLVGYVGSRDITEQDLTFTVGCVRKTVALGSGVVSGGARGVDTVAATEALRCGGTAVEYLAEALLKKLHKNDVQRNIRQGKLLLMAVANPDTGFRTSIAMMRNRYIYAQSAGTVVIRSDLETGGTWSGAVDNLKNGYAPTLCRDHPYPGNQALIRKGAIPIDETWDGQIPQDPPDLPAETCTQTSFFEVK